MPATPKLETDFINLARIALSGRQQDVQQLLYRLSRAHRETMPELAQALTELLRKAPTRESPLRRQSEIALPVDLDTRFQLLRVDEHPMLDHEPIFAPQLADSLDRLVAERLNLKALFDDGLEPTRAAIFMGPPGVGKTMAARWIARSLQRPLLVLDLAAVMSSYLGRTGTNLRHVLDYAKTLDCVLLLDEIDAIAKRRDDQAEIGELKRLVTVLIQQIDDWPSSNLLLAATNHAFLLDPAIWRRFDALIEFPLPSEEAIEAMVRSILQDRANDDWIHVLSLALVGQSFSEIERALIQARRASVISNTNLEPHLQKLLHNPALPKAKLIGVAGELVRRGLASQRKARELTGLARDTIRAHAAKEDVKPRRTARRKDG
jgi:SpoVK/Ycf46/Vps4 family AAA+-type ATPase